MMTIHNTNTCSFVYFYNVQFPTIYPGIIVLQEKKKNLQYTTNLRQRIQTPRPIQTWFVKEHDVLLQDRP